MLNSRHFISRFVWALAVIAALSAHAADADEMLIGPAYSKFRLTLAPGWRTEAVGPFFFDQSSEGQRQWGIPPFFCQTITPDVDWSEWEIFYPVIGYRRFGTEYRLQLCQVLNWSGGETQSETNVQRTTVFPIYFRQRSRETNLNYTAVFPFYGHLENRLFRDDIKFVAFPAYSRTRKNDVVTYNYLYPIFDRRRGDGMKGWQVWPIFGHDHKDVTVRTNNYDEAVTNGGYDKRFALWPFYFRDTVGVGTTNPVKSVTVIPAYSETRSPARDETSYGFPLGWNAIHDHERGYVEHDFLWPLFVWSHGSKRVTRYTPIYSHAEYNGLKSISYGFVLYKFNSITAPPLERRRSRVLYFLYSDTVERNTQTHDFERRLDIMPIYSYHRELDGNRRIQILSILEPLFPNNRTMSREYSPLWTLWKAERNPKTGAGSQSLLWNLYRHEREGTSRKASLLFGLIQYQSMPNGGHWRICYINVGRKSTVAGTAKS